jgi:hypothetical protein
MQKSRNKGVYVVFYGLTWYLYIKVKIGKTNNYKARLNAYKTHNFKVKFLLWRECQNEHAFEKKLHKIFKTQRVSRREFFVLSPLRFFKLFLKIKFSQENAKQ